MARPAWEVLFGADGSDFRQDVNRNIQIQRRFNQTMGNANRSFRQFNTFQARATSLMRGFLAVAAGGGLLQLGRGIVQMVDEVRVLEGQLRAGTEELGNFYQAQDQLRGLAEQANTSIDALTRGYSQLALSADRASLSHENIIVILETFANAARIGGSSTEDLTEALRQMGQAAAEGRVQWEDLTIIMDRLVGIRATLNRYASSRDTTLRTLTSTGFSFDQLLEALNQDRSRLAQSAGGAADTVANSFNRLVASVRQSVAQLDELLGITSGISASFDSLRDTIEGVDIGKVAGEMYAFFIQVRNVLDPLVKLTAILLEQKFLLNTFLFVLRNIDYILIALVFSGIGKLARQLYNLGRAAAATVSASKGLLSTLSRLGNLLGGIGTLLAALVLIGLRIATLRGLDLWGDIEPPPTVERSLFQVRNELKKLLEEIDRARGLVGGADGFGRLLREALLVEGRQTPGQQQQQDQSQQLADRIAKMRTFLLQNEELSNAFVRESRTLREILLLFNHWDTEAKRVADEVARLEGELEKAESTVDREVIQAKLVALRKELEEANRAAEAMRKRLASLVDKKVENDLDSLEAKFKEVRQSMVDDINAMVAGIQGLKDELGNFVLSNDLRDAFGEVRRLLAIPDVGFSYDTAQRAVRLIREGKTEFERRVDLSGRELYTRQNSLKQAELELSLAKKRQELGEGNVQELIKEVKAKEALVTRSKEEVANAEQANKLARDRLSAYNSQASVLLDIANTRGQIAFEQDQIIRLGQQANEQERLKREQAELDARRRLEEYMNRLLQARANLFAQIRQMIEQIGGNLLDQVLRKTQSWGDFLRENLRLLAQFILRLTFIEPLANKLTGLVYPSGAEAVKKLSGVAVPVFPVPTSAPTGDVGDRAPSGFGGRRSSKPVIIQNITVDAVDARGIERVLRSNSRRIATETMNFDGDRRYF